MIEIICEIGINHCGDIDLAKAMIWEAKHCGADVAKFQIYDPKRLLDPNHPALKDHWDTILKTELTRDQVITLREECDKADIEFLASVFRPDVVEWTEEIGMKRYKIASRSIYDKSLAKAIYQTGKPVIVSYGMYEQGWPPQIWWQYMEEGVIKGRPPISKLYCISKYPAPISDIDFYDGGKHSLFQQGVFQGFSDHIEGITASVVAMSLGAKIIEKHVTADKRLPGPDQSSSITFTELERLCNMRDDIEVILYG